MTPPKNSSNQMKLDFDAEPPDDNADAANGVVRDDTARILDGVVAQDGAHWIRWGTDRTPIWFAVADLSAHPGSVWARLIGAGLPLLTSKSQNQLKEEVQAFIKAGRCRPGLVSAGPGWVSNAYVCGDGRKLGPSEGEIIIGFSPEAKFTPKGTLDEWKAAVMPFGDEPLVLFAVAFGLVGAMMELAPDDYQNPLVELYGARETGKSTLAKFAASVWSGRSNANVGGCESWDQTTGAIDVQKRRHKDGLLVLNEANLADARQIRDAVFKLAEPGQRLRIDSDLQAVQHGRLAVLSTTNRPIAELCVGDDAAASRMVTITADLPFGILKSVPTGFASARDAVEHLGRAANEAYGTAGPAFAAELARLAAKDVALLRATIKRHLDRYLGLPEACDPKFARHAKVFALAAVAGFLGAKYRVVPFKQKQMVDAILELHAAAIGTKAKQGMTAAPTVAPILAYLDRVEGKLIRVRDLDGPLSPEAFVRKPGFVARTRDGYELYVPSERFQREFPDYLNLMRTLRETGLARTEGGKKPKLTIKTPREICTEGRVYCVKINAERMPRNLR